MRRLMASLSVVLVLTLCSIACDDFPEATAQTTAWIGAQTADGVTLELLTFGPAFDAPPPVSIGLARLTVEPGHAFRLIADDPTMATVLVQSGTFAARVDAPVSIKRAVEVGTDTLPRWETIPAGKSFTLNAGDVALIPASVDGEIRNPGSTLAVARVVLVGPTGL